MLDGGQTRKEGRNGIAQQTSNNLFGCLFVVCSNSAFHQLWIVCFSSPCIVCHFFAAVGREDFNISTQLDRKGNVIFDKGIIVQVFPTLGSKLLDLLQKYSHSVNERAAWDDKTVV